jgi:hypothetical protein
MKRGEEISKGEGCQDGMLSARGGSRVLMFLEGDETSPNFQVSRFGTNHYYEIAAFQANIYVFSCTSRHA